MVGYKKVGGFIASPHLPFNHAPASNPKNSPDKCAVCAIISPDPIMRKSKRAKRITTIHISIGRGSGKMYTFIFGINTASVAIMPLIAPLAPTAGILEVKHQPIPAKIPARKKITRNFALPIFRSSTGAKKKNTNMLTKKCMKLPWRKICVTNVHGLSSTRAGISIKCSVYPGMSNCKKKEMAMSSKSRNEQLPERIPRGFV